MNKRRAVVSVAVATALGALLAIGAWVGRNRDGSAGTTTQNPDMTRWIDCVIRAKDGREVAVFPTVEGLREFMAITSRASDEHAASAVALLHDAFLVESGTECTFADVRPAETKVRIIEGLHAGKQGWVPTEVSHEIHYCPPTARDVTGACPPSPGL